MKSVFVLFSVLFFGFANASTFNNYSKNVNGIDLRIDWRIELFNCIAMQAGHTGMSATNIGYRQQCIEFFSGHDDLQAPAILMETWRKGWTVDDPIFFLLHLNDDFSLRPGIDKGIIERAGGITQIKKLCEAMKIFAQKTNFQEFFNRIQKPFYEQVISQTAYHFRDFDGIRTMEKYFGTKCRSYTLVLNLNGGYGNFGTSLQNHNGNELVAVVETGEAVGGIPVFTPNIATVDLVFHEFSHGFANAFLDAYAEKVKQTEKLYEPISASMQSQGYWNWSVTLNEHVIRALVVRLAANQYGEDFSRMTFYKIMLGRRFIYGDRLLEKLESYEKQRDRYRDFASFVPELLESLSPVDSNYVAEKQQKTERMRVPQIASIPKSNEFAHDSTTVFIVSSHENDVQRQTAMIEFVKRYRDMHSGKIRIMTDEQALQSDLTENDLVVFGTIEGNTFLKRYIDRFPIVLQSDKIITNKVVRGKNLQLVMSWTSPLNDKKSMVVYTAQNIEDVNDFYKSPVKDNYHFWVAEKLITVDKGSYGRYFEVWMPEIF
ncbi:DUF4932 domain-containing protein [Flavobacterium sp. MAH-1]|uniref:DUF4932 domain-containing protein n=1 Tax=Flavobacterium agri TaxID=2743471 RepID=A0A7Y8Y352_9FLAO|nr:DUF4932 domain-containing protein [Flavobacterium agri]NUY81476.1 DUF4932 domain-containing protein [Flavobacterium agri]NYA71500.1 DUF4932 domain-containing protein [Flavobacterium agri]